MKIQGRDLKRFYDQGWPGDDWYEDGGIDDIDGIQETSLYDSSHLGCIEWQGSSEPQPNRLVYPGQEVATLYRRWIKSQAIRSMLIEFDAKNEAGVLDALKRVGARVVKGSRG